MSCRPDQPTPDGPILPELLRTALPLMLSTAANTLQQVVDRLFLNWYSAEAVAAALPAGVTHFLLMTFFLGTAGYVSTFVAQYEGAGLRGRVPAVMAQGLAVSLAGAVLLMATAPAAPAFFAWLGHDPQVREAETAYYSVLALGSFPFLFANLLSSFFSGVGHTWPVLAANLVATGVNIVLDYGLIFGRLGLPEMGIAGAGIATVVASAASCVCYLVFMALPAYRTYGLLRSVPRLDLPLLGRLLRFGAASGLQFFLDVVGWTGVILLIGRLGTAELAASNIAFNINMFAFMPMVGLGTAVSVLVGRHLGADRPARAEGTVRLAFVLTMAYMGLVACLYWFVPGLFLAPYRLAPELAGLTRLLLRFVAAYCLFDAMNIVFVSALKGAGDTAFTVAVFGLWALLGLVVPSYVLVVRLGAGIVPVWWVITLYIAVLGLVFLVRFLGGRWKGMRVIEPNLLPCPGVPA